MKVRSQWQVRNIRDSSPP